MAVLSAASFATSSSSSARKPRTKEPEQLCRELDALLATGFRGSLFVVDDNFVGNRKETLALLGRLGPWMHDHDFPFQSFTEASIDLAGWMT